jgi:hypothetical protein
MWCCTLPRPLWTTCAAAWISRKRLEEGFGNARVTNKQMLNRSKLSSARLSQGVGTAAVIVTYIKLMMLEEDFDGEIITSLKNAHEGFADLECIENMLPVLNSICNVANDEVTPPLNLLANCHIYCSAGRRGLE